MTDQELEEFEFRARAEEEAAAARVREEQPNPVDNIAGQAAIAATPAATQLTAAAGRGILNAPVTVVTAPFTSPISTIRGVAGAIENVVPRVPTQVPLPPGSGVLSMPGTRAMNVGELLKAGAQAGARGVGSALTAPESMFLAPYNMAAYEQAKIRANPNAPGLQNNPYAQTVRGEQSTQAQAGAANTRQALIGQQYGGLNPQEQAIMQQERQRQMQVQQRQQKARQVLQQPPTAQNFIERSKAMAELYGGVGQ